MPISEYLKNIRSKIGHDLVVVPSASVSILDDQRRLLLGQDTEREIWTLPGGTIDPHEHPADAAVRECWEETGLLVRAESLIGVFGGPDFLVRYPNGDIVYSVATAFQAVIIGGSLRSGDGEMSQLRYFSESECGSLTMSTPARLIAKATFASSSEPYFQPATWSVSSNKT